MDINLTPCLYRITTTATNPVPMTTSDLLISTPSRCFSSSTPCSSRAANTEQGIGFAGPNMTSVNQSHASWSVSEPTRQANPSKPKQYGAGQGATGQGHDSHHHQGRSSFVHTCSIGKNYFTLPRRSKAQPGNCLEQTAPTCMEQK